MENSIDNLPSRYDSKDYKMSRRAHIWECTFEYFVTLLVASPFITYLLFDLGFTDSEQGLVTEILNFAFLIQLLCVPLASKIKNRRRFSLISHSISSIFFAAMYFIPFLLPISATAKKTLLVVVIICAYTGRYLVSNIIYRWGNSFVNPDKRARFGATKEMISLVTGAVVTFVSGIIVDPFVNYEVVDGVKGPLSSIDHKAFLFIGISILVYSIVDFITLFIMKNEVSQSSNSENVKEEKETFRSIIVKIFSNKSFLLIVIFSFIFSMSVSFATPFVGTFRVKTLKLPATLITGITFIGLGVRAIVSRPFGRFTDKTSYITGVILGMFIKVAAFIALAFTSTNCWWLIIIYQVFTDVGNAGTGMNMNNILYSYVDKKYYSEAASLKNAVNGLGHILGGVFGKLIFDAIGNEGISVGGFLGYDTIYAQQILGLVVVGLLAICIVFAFFIIRPMKTEGR